MSTPETRTYTSYTTYTIYTITCNNTLTLVIV